MSSILDLSNIYLMIKLRLLFFGKSLKEMNAFLITSDQGVPDIHMISLLKVFAKFLPCKVIIFPFINLII